MPPALSRALLASFLVDIRRTSEFAPFNDPSDESFGELSGMSGRSRGERGVDDLARRDNPMLSSGYSR